MRVLVVEDDAKLARILAKALAEEGFAVDTCRGGREALEKVASAHFGLVVLDWMLPELEGIAVCRELRRLGSGVPILMVSARADVGDRVSALDAGADDYLTKPFHLEELLARVRAWMRRAASEKKDVRVGTLTIDLVGHVVIVKGRRVDLTPREYALIALLAKNAGRPVSRKDILENVWQTSRDLGSNAMEVHVKNLREKLGADAPPIETVRGLGYRLAGEESGP
jgi:DNA-binding response OmpR family regulator